MHWCVFLVGDFHYMFDLFYITVKHQSQQTHITAIGE